MFNEKQKLRQHCKNIRKNLDINSISKKIIDNLFFLDEFKKTLNVFSYISFGTEVDTKRILELKEKNIFVPKIKNEKIIMCKYDKSNLNKNKYGILEPINEEIKIPKKNDIIIVPALAADKNFSRLGYGSGYYDRYLKNTNSVLVILLPSALFLENIPIEKHDVKCDYIITEKEILKNTNSVLIKM